jgi:hypothetical protein
MSVCCNITVQFPVKSDTNLFVCARRHLDAMETLKEATSYPSAEDGYNADAHRMLRYAAEVHGVGTGPKGDMFTWGSIGNYSSIEDFVTALRPFWIDLYTTHAMFDSEGVVVMFQQEQRPFVKFAEISMDRTAPGEDLVLIRRDWETPFPLFGWFFERPEELLPPAMQTTIWKGRTP